MSRDRRRSPKSGSRTGRTSRGCWDVQTRKPRVLTFHGVQALAFCVVWRPAPDTGSPALAERQHTPAPNSRSGYCRAPRGATGTPVLSVVGPTCQRRAGGVVLAGDEGRVASGVTHQCGGTRRRDSTHAMMKLEAIASVSTLRSSRAPHRQHYSPGPTRLGTVTTNALLRHLTGHDLDLSQHTDNEETKNPAATRSAAGPASADVPVTALPPVPPSPPANAQSGRTALVCGPRPRSR